MDEHCVVSLSSHLFWIISRLLAGGCSPVVGLWLGRKVWSEEERRGRIPCQRGPRERKRGGQRLLRIKVGELRYAALEAKFTVLYVPRTSAPIRPLVL